MAGGEIYGTYHWDFNSATKSWVKVTKSEPVKKKTHFPEWMLK